MTKALDDISKNHRKTILKMIQECRRGHIGSAFSLVEIMRVLYDDVLRFNAQDPLWCDRDRLVLSKGHGCLALYLQLVEKGFVEEAELWKISALDAKFGGHPEFGLAPGVEASTGSLGHGLPMAVGMALAGKMDKKDYRVFAIIGDGESNEGSVWESAMVAAKHQLANLTIIVDYNKFQCYSYSKEILNLEPFVDKWQSFGCSVQEVDGHDVALLQERFKVLPYASNKPSVLICHTTKGKGIAELENNPAWHHKTRLPEEEIDKLMEALS